MNYQFFSLRPFPSSGFLPRVKIAGNIGRRSNALYISYEMRGNMGELSIPATADVPVRKNALWEETCFEFFLGLKNSGRYWEFNLSPAGHWNVYSLASYRQDMHEEPAFTSLPFSALTQPDALLLSLKLDLEKIIPERRALEVAISAVIKTMNGKITYWALTHPGDQADFHRRETFILKL